MSHGTCMHAGFYAREEGFDDQNSIEVLQKALDLGITMLSTAAFYGPHGENETLIGGLCMRAGSNKLCYLPACCLQRVL